HPKRAMVISPMSYRSECPSHAPGAEGIYFGHVFLINIFQLRFYLTHVGFKVLGVDTTRYSWRSLLLAPFLFLPVTLATRKLVRAKRSKIPPDMQRTILDEVLRSAVFFGRKLIMAARKPHD
ncbi:MAG: hypothetical protein PVJ87_08800, partial [Desulfobacterales bacterium]